MRLGAALLLASALPALAEGGPTAAQMDAMVAAMTAANCEITPDNQDAVLAASGLTPEVATSVVIALVDKGAAAYEGEVRLFLTAGGCK